MGGDSGSGDSGGFGPQQDFDPGLGVPSEAAIDRIVSGAPDPYNLADTYSETGAGVTPVYVGQPDKFPTLGQTVGTKLLPSQRAAQRSGVSGFVQSGLGMAGIDTKEGSYTHSIGVPSFLMSVGKVLGASNPLSFLASLAAGTALDFGAKKLGAPDVATLKIGPGVQAKGEFPLYNKLVENREAKENVEERQAEITRELKTKIETGIPLKGTEQEIKTGEAPVSFDDIRNFAGNLITQGGQSITRVVEDIVDAVDDVTETLSNVVTETGDIAEDVKDALVGYGEDIQEGVVNLLDKEFSGRYGSFTRGVQDLAGGAVDALSKGATTVGEGVLEPAAKTLINIVEPVANIAEQLPSETLNIAKAMGGDVEKLVIDLVGTGGKSLLRSTGEAIGSVVNPALKLLDKNFGSGEDYSSIKTPSTVAQKKSEKKVSGFDEDRYGDDGNVPPILPKKKTRVATLKSGTPVSATKRTKAEEDAYQAARLQRMRRYGFRSLLSEGLA